MPLSNVSLKRLFGMVGATSLLAGETGLAPKPLAGDQLKFLRGDATYATPGGNSIVRVVAGTSDSITAGDAGATVVYTNAGAAAVTLPTLAAAGVGFTVTLVNAAGAPLTLTRAGTDTFDGGASVLTLSNIAGARQLTLFAVNSARWYTSERVFVSAPQTITPGGFATVAHGLGGAPRYITVFAQCVTAEFGYVAGDLALLTANARNDTGSGAASGFGVDASTTTITLHFSNPALMASNKTTHAPAILTPANWNAIIKATF